MDVVNFEDEILNGRSKKSRKELEDKIKHPNIELIGRVNDHATEEYEAFNQKVDELVKLASNMALFHDDIENIREGLVDHFSSLLYSYVVDFDPLDPEVTDDDLHTHNALVERIIKKYHLMDDTK